MSILRSYIVEVLSQEKDARGNPVTSAIKKIQPNLEKMTKSELELLKYQIERLIGKL